MVVVSKSGYRFCSFPERFRAVNDRPYTRSGIPDVGAIIDRPKRSMITNTKTNAVSYNYAAIAGQRARWRGDRRECPWCNLPVPSPFLHSITNVVPGDSHVAPLGLLGMTWWS